MRRFWLIVLVVWGTAVSTSTVFAHTELILAAPVPGSSVETLSEIRLVFSEPITADSQIEVLQDFVSVAELHPVIDPDDATVLVTAVPPLPDGVYTVQWSVTSADGHPISGSYSLAINTAPLQPAKPWIRTIWALAGIVLIVAALVTLVLRRWKPVAVPQRGQNG